jgi:hypothetical protein
VTLASEAKEAEADEFVKDVLLRGFIAGDLAYFEILLGKEGADSAWCPWCKLSHRQWQEVLNGNNRQLGELWTIESIAATAADVTAYGILGVKMDPILDAIAVERYLVPSLHVSMGLGNRFFAINKEFVTLLENAPDSVKEARNAWYKACNDLEDSEGALAIWGQTHGQELARKSLEHHLLVQWQRETTEFSVDEQRAIKDDKEAALRDVKKLTKDRKDLEKAKSEQSKNVDSTKKAPMDTAEATWRQERQP